MNPVADSALVDSIPSGGPDFITDWEPMCKQQKSSHKALAHGVCVPRWDRRLKKMHVREDTWLLKDYLCLQDACKCFNFRFLQFRVHSWNWGRWPSELKRKYETAASLWLPVALVLWTQIEAAINLCERKKSLYFKSCKWAWPCSRDLEIYLFTPGCEQPAKGRHVPFGGQRSSYWSGNQ